METILWFKMSAYIRNASEQLCFFCKNCKLPGWDRSHLKDSMHFKVRPFTLSWDNEVIIHWTTVLLKWVSSLKLLHHDAHIVWWTGFCFIPVIFTSIVSFPSLLPAFLFCVIKWMWKPGVTVSGFAKGWSCLELFCWIYFTGFFYKIFPVAKMFFRNVDRYQKQHFSFPWAFFFPCGKNGVDFFSKTVSCDSWSLIDEKIFFDGCIYCAYN